MVDIIKYRAFFPTKCRLFAKNTKTLKTVKINVLFIPKLYFRLVSMKKKNKKTMKE